MRAITSSLSTRSAPPIPPSTVLFEPLVKGVLRHRLLSNIFAYSLVFSWIQTVLWRIWSSGSAGDGSFNGILWTLVRPTTLFFAVLRWAVIPMPVIILRKRYLTGEVFWKRIFSGITPLFTPTTLKISQPNHGVVAVYAATDFFVEQKHSASVRDVYGLRSAGGTPSCHGTRSRRLCQFQVRPVPLTHCL